MSNVISEEQRRLNQALHEQNQDFGNRSDGAGVAGNLPNTVKRMHELGICESILDYGTGKGKLVQRLKDELPESISVTGYDPAMPKFCKKPKDKSDIVVCLDVLEHIEMQSIDAVLNDIKNLTGKFCYLVIDLQPAVKKLNDGRNAHILLAPADWWVNKLNQIFPCIASFPIYHNAGIPQKIVIACTSENKNLTYMYSFLIKLNIFNFAMKGGVLQGMIKDGQ